MISKPPNGHIIDIKSSAGRPSIVMFFFSPLSAKSYLQSTTVCIVPLAGIISCRLAFASLSHVVGWVWEHALRKDYSRQGIEGLWGIWQLSSHINSSPPPPLFYFFVGCLFVYLKVWWDADTCPACLIVIVGVCGLVRTVGAERALQTSRWGNSGCRVCDCTTGTLVCVNITPLSGCFGGAAELLRAASAQHCSTVLLHWTFSADCCAWMERLNFY